MVVADDPGNLPVATFFLPDIIGLVQPGASVSSWHLDFSIPLDVEKVLAAESLKTRLLPLQLESAILPVASETDHDALESREFQ